MVSSIEYYGLILFENYPNVMWVIIYVNYATSRTVRKHAIPSGIGGVAVPTLKEGYRLLWIPRGH